MRLVLLLPALLLLAGCGTISSYNADKGESPSSLQGDQGGAGVQTSIWSTDPNRKTLTNSNAP